MSECAFRSTKREPSAWEARQRSASRSAVSRASKGNNCALTDGKTARRPQNRRIAPALSADREPALYASHVKGIARTLCSLAVFTVPAFFMVAGCEADSESSSNATCSADVAPALEPFNDAVLQLDERLAELQASLAVACANIAADLGVSGVPEVGDGSQLAAVDVAHLCDQAATAIGEATATAGPLELVTSTGLCLVDLNGQLACEESCAPELYCPEGALGVRCWSHDLWGRCYAGCSGHCVADPDTTVSCDGPCAGTCTGSCQGTCGADCDGPCAGLCTGECSGDCEVVPPSAACTGWCRQGCSAELDDPGCAKPLYYSPCDYPSDCECICGAAAWLGAECIPPVVAVAGDSTLKVTLEQNLPAILLGHTHQCLWLAEAALCLSDVDLLENRACPELLDEATGALAGASATLATLCGAAANVAGVP